MFDRTEAAFRGGADWLQIRERSLQGGALLSFARALAERAARGAEADGRRAVVLVNRRVDVALAIGAEGVHLGFDAVTADDARALLGERAMIGASVHGDEELESAREAKVDYAHLAPIFDPRSKPAERPALGLGALEQAARKGVPILAQGGVTPENTGELVRCGARGVAVTGTLLSADDPEACARDFRAALDSR